MPRLNINVVDSDAVELDLIKPNRKFQIEN